MSSGCQGASQTSGYLHQSVVEASLNRHGDQQRDDQERQNVEWERETRTAESNSQVDPHPKKVIPYKEYAARKEVERKIWTTSKLTLEEEENWDEEPHFTPHETPPGAKPMVPSQEDEWKLMVN